MTLTKPQLTLSRRYKAPASKLFAAWTEPEKMLQWFCPHGFTVVNAVSEPRPGGAFGVTMLNPDGGEHENRGEYLEVIPNEKIVLTWGWVDEPGVHSQVTVTFKESNGETLLTLIHEGFPTDSSRDSHIEGWTGALENLARFVG